MALWRAERWERSAMALEDRLSFQLRQERASMAMEDRRSDQIRQQDFFNRLRRELVPPEDRPGDLEWALRAYAEMQEEIHAWRSRPY